MALHVCVREIRGATTDEIVKVSVKLGSTMSHTAAVAPVRGCAVYGETLSFPDAVPDAKLLVQFWAPRSTVLGSVTANVLGSAVHDVDDRWFTVKSTDGRTVGEVRLCMMLEPAAGGAPGPSAPVVAAVPMRGAVAAASAAGSPVYMAVPSPVPAPSPAPSAAGGTGLPDMLDGKYKVLKQLGSGNFGRVYKVQSTMDDAIYALKMIAIETPEVLESIRSEAKTLLRLVHANVVRYYSSFMHTDGSGRRFFCMVMEYCDSGHLNDRIVEARRDGQRINDGQIGLWLLQISSALAYMHANGLLHRDLKGDNVFLLGGESKLADFGLAQSGVATGQAGAYAYESPEQAQGHAYDGRNDVWALGCMLSELVTLRFVGERGTGAVALNAGIVNAMITETKALHPEFGDLIANLLAVDPSKRWTAEQLVVHLTPQLPTFQVRLRGTVVPVDSPNPGGKIRLTCSTCGVQTLAQVEVVRRKCWNCSATLIHGPCGTCGLPVCHVAGATDGVCPGCRSAVRLG